MCFRLFALLFSSICFLEVSAQDPHFSQFYASPLTLNPALTGLFAGEGRISSTYRNQWQSISNPFTTGTVAFDTRALRRVFKEQNVFGLGGMALYDQSNNGGLRSRYLAFTAGYNQQLDKYGHHRLGIGFQASFVSKTIDYTKFLFSRQFTPIGFDPTLPTGEPRSTLGINYPDMGTGILYSGISNTEQQWYIGASYYHITRPNESMTGGDAKLSPRTTIHAGYNFSVNEMSKLYFSGLYMNSAISSEVMIGYHSGISALLNIGLLDPLDVIEKAVKKKSVKIQSIEGFVRQILSWREYVRLLYIKEHNTFIKKKFL
jgi:type IX secretion system PorP/SprF family membrane protein